MYINMVYISFSRHSVSGEFSRFMIYKDMNYFATSKNGIFLDVIIFLRFFGELK